MVLHVVVVVARGRCCTWMMLRTDDDVACGRCAAWMMLRMDDDVARGRCAACTMLHAMLRGGVFAADQ